MDNNTYYTLEIALENGAWKSLKNVESRIVSIYRDKDSQILFKTPYNEYPKTFEILISYVETLNNEWINIVNKKEIQILDTIEKENNLVSNPFILLDFSNKVLTTTLTGEIPIYITVEDGKILIQSNNVGFKSTLLPPATILKFSGTGLAYMGTILDNYVNNGVKQTTDIEFLSTLLIHIVKSRLEYIANHVVNRFYISFSGGVDSSLILKIAYECGFDVTPVTIGLKESKDIREIKESLKAVGYKGDLILLEVDEDDVLKTLQHIKSNLEIKNKILLSIACVEHLLMEKIKGEVLVMGQGADELFGGYDKYRREYNRFIQENIIDRALLYRATTLLEYKLGELNRVSVGYPYLTYLGNLLGKLVPHSYKVKGRDDYHRKWVIREALKMLGSSREAYMRRKRAMQYSTGIDKVVKDILRKL